MAYRLAMETPHAFTAIAVIAANLPVADNMDCTPNRKPISVAIFNGTQDPVNPYQGGLVKVGDDYSRGEVLSTQQTIDYWKDVNGVDSSPEIVEFPQIDNDSNTSVSRYRWLSDNKNEVLLYKLEGSGHVIPSKISHFPRIVGRESRDISAVHEIVDFFLQQNERSIIRQ